MKKIKMALSLMLVSLLLLGLIPTFSVGAADGSYEAQYATPVVDGTIDSVWDKAEWGLIDKTISTQSLTGKAQFKILWDDTYLYILLQHQDAGIDKATTWNNFSRIIVDEQGDKKLTDGQNADWMMSAIIDGTNTSKFSVGAWGKNAVTDIADRLTSAGSYTEAADGKSAVINYEIRLKLVNAPKANQEIGFDVSVTERPAPEITACWNYDPTAGDRANSWSWSVIAQNYENVGKVKLVKKANPVVTATYDADYATPVVDGTIDSVWDKVEWAAIDHTISSQSLTGKAQFKILWDDTYLYILLQHQDAGIDKTTTWNNFSRIIVDEQKDKKLTDGQNADWMMSAIIDGANTSKFSVGAWGKNAVTDIADRLTSAGSYTEAADGKSAVINYEIRLKLVNAPKENQELGFDVSVTERPAPEITACWNYDPTAGDRANSWSWSVIAQNYENVGVVKLIKTASSEPEQPEQPENPDNSYENSDGLYHADYGTPKVDGKIDQVWNRVEWASIGNTLSTKPLEGAAQFKILWDDTYLYILLQHKDVNIDRAATWNDFSRILVDEQKDKKLTEGQSGDWMMTAIVNGETAVADSGLWGKYTVNDFADRVTYTGVYTEEGGGAVITYEYRLKLVTAPAENRELGFDVSYTERPQEATACWNYDPTAGDRADRWSWSIIAQDYENVGTVKLIKNTSSDAETGEVDTGFAPNTGDYGMVALFAALIPALGISFVAKKRKIQ